MYFVISNVGLKVTAIWLNFGESSITGRRNKYYSNMEVSVTLRRSSTGGTTF